MFNQTSVRRLFVFFLTIFFVVISLFDLVAQSFDNDPLMLDGGDGFGFDQFGEEDFQRSEFGYDGLQGFDPPPEQDPFDPFEQQIDSGNKYLDEGTFSDETESTLKDDLIVRRNVLSQEGQDAPSNLGYGAGSGLMIGTWFAFIRKQTNTRQQFRTIGTSTVLGAIVGILLGTRSVWNPGAPRPEDSTKPTGFLQIHPEGWSYSQNFNKLKISYRLKF